MRESLDRPNFILIICDDLGYGDLGCYGSEVHSTPRLDQAAAEGVRFTEFYSGSPVCSPSRAALMTGCYPQRVGLGVGADHPVLMPGDPIGLDPSEVTIANALKQEGYATSIVGKWHLGDQPEFLPSNHGFDEYFGIPYSNDMGLQSGLAEQGYVTPPLPLLRQDRVSEVEPDQTSLTARYSEEALSFIEKNHDRPFFLYIAHVYVHGPRYPPAEYLARSRNGAYGAEVEHLDWCTGAILDKLEEFGIDENTVLIFTSDHGSSSGSNLPLRGGKGSTWEGGVRVPCIMRWPGVVTGGTVRNDILAFMDVLPTLCELAGGDIPSGSTDGRSFKDLLLEGSNGPRNAYFYYRSNRLEAVRIGKWKLHVETTELYDLEADVGETEDIADAHPEVVSRLEAAAQTCRRDLGDATLRHLHRGVGCRPPGRVANPVTILPAEKLSAPTIKPVY